VERRKRRSADPIVALHLQLAAVRTAAELEAVVLVDDMGCVVAGAGAWPICEELAAFTPFLIANTTPCSRSVASQAAKMAPDTHLLPMSIDGMDVVLCARAPQGKNIEYQMDRAAAGCQRILSVAC